MQFNRLKSVKGFHNITDHFGGKKFLSRLVIFLFAFGIIIFFINNIIIFTHYDNREEILCPRLTLKALTDLAWISASALGAKYYPTMRNRLLIPTIILYMIGDIAVLFSWILGGVFYIVGHMFLIIAIVETTYIRKWQYYVMLAGTLIMVVAIFMLAKDPILIIAAIVYGTIVTATMALSLSNRFFRISGFVFYLSDAVGVLRVALFDNRVGFIISTVIYFAAFFMLCISVFSTNRKEVVTINDLLRMLSDSRSKDISFWVCGKWAMGLIRGDRKYSYDHIDLAYDIDHVEEFMDWMKNARYESKHRYVKGIRNFYSEKYGSIQVFPCIFMADGSAILTNKNGHQLELDEGFFEEVQVFGEKIPCIAPGGQELIKEAALSSNTE